MRRHVAVAAAVVLIALAGFAGPASAATKPSKVGMVSFTAAGYSSSSASLTFRWPKAAYAKSYEIFLSTSYSGVLAASVHKKVSGTSTTLTGLEKGRTYYVMVRGANGSAKGTRSSRVGRTTIAGQGKGENSPFSVLTWNLCSETSKGCRAWSPRVPGILGVIDKYQPSVVALQESIVLAKNGEDAIPGYTRAAYYSSKALYLREDDMEVVHTGTGGRTDGHLSTCTEGVGARYGCVNLGNSRYAVWAEVQDKREDQRAIFVSVHLTSGKSDNSARLREGETNRLIDGIKKVNTGGLPVVFAGDFNTHRNRSNDYPAAVFRSAVYRDAYDLAQTVGRQHYNSYNNWSTTPTLSTTWGDHVDKVWVRHHTSKVLLWANVAPMTGSGYSSPLPSDHNPVLVRVQLD